MHFLDDEDKMMDIRVLTKEEFLSSYSYLTEEEYNETIERMEDTWCLDWNLAEDDMSGGFVKDVEYFKTKELMKERIDELKAEYDNREGLEYEWYQVKKCKSCGQWERIGDEN